MMNTHNVSIYPELVLYRRRIRGMAQPNASENEPSFRTTTNPAPAKHPPSSIHPLRHMSEVRPHKNHPQPSATERSHAGQSYTQGLHLKTRNDEASNDSRTVNVFLLQGVSLSTHLPFDAANHLQQRRPTAHAAASKYLPHIVT